MRYATWYSLILLTFLFPFQIAAQNAPPPGQKVEPGWLVKAGISLMSMKSTGQLDDKIDSYDEDPQVEEKVLPLPTLQLIYNDRAETGNWLFGSKRSGLVIERRQKTGIGVFAVEAGVNLFSLVKVDLPTNDYKNPYLLGETRDTTGKSQITQTASYSVGKAFGLTLRANRLDLKYEDDETPEVDSALGRNGYKETGTVELRLWLLGLGYDSISNHTEGEADSYTGFNQSGNLRIPLFIEGLMAIVRGSYGKAEYEAVHPIFNETREDITESSTFMLMYRTEERTIQFLSSHSKTDSNIDFFDKSSSVISLGATWDF